LFGARSDKKRREAIPPQHKETKMQKNTYERQAIELLNAGVIKILASRENIELLTAALKEAYEGEMAKSHALIKALGR